ncbi:MAG: ABC transporter permease subunit, partial [Rubrimonas sp.]
MTHNTPRAGTSRRPRLTAEDRLGLAVVAALTLLVLAPMAAVIAQAFLPGVFSGRPPQFTLTALVEILDRPLWRRALWNSLFLASVAAVLGGALGAGLAMLRHAGRPALGPALDLAAWALIVLPSFILAQGGILFASRSGVAAQWLGMDWVPGVVFNPWGLAAVMALKSWPFAYLTTAAALQWRMDDYAHAARLCGAGPLRVLATVRLPMLAPAILSGALLIFIDVIGDFGLPAALISTAATPPGEGRLALGTPLALLGLWPLVLLLGLAVAVPDIEAAMREAVEAGLSQMGAELPPGMLDQVVQLKAA